MRLGIWLAAVLLAGQLAASAEVLVLNNTNGPPFTTLSGDGFLDRVLRQVSARTGLQLQLLSLPAERGLFNANEGIDDGDLVRIAGLEKDYPNLVRVPEKLVDWNFSAFSHRRDLTVTGWKDLLPYTVGFIRGWKIAEANLAAAAVVVRADDEDELFEMLLRDRVDVVVYSLEMGADYLNAHSVASIHALSPPLATREMYIYLNKKHAAAVPKIAAALREVKADGFYGRAYRETVGKTLRAAPQ